MEIKPNKKYFVLEEDDTFFEHLEFNLEDVPTEDLIEEVENRCHEGPDNMLTPEQRFKLSRAMEVWYWSFTEVLDIIVMNYVNALDRSIKIEDLSPMVLRHAMETLNKIERPVDYHYTPTQDPLETALRMLDGYLRYFEVFGDYTDEESEARANKAWVEIKEDIVQHMDLMRDTLHDECYQPHWFDMGFRYRDEAKNTRMMNDDEEDNT
jgi:hypothetical protein